MTAENDSEQPSSTFWLDKATFDTQINKYIELLNTKINEFSNTHPDITKYVDTLKTNIQPPLELIVENINTLDRHTALIVGGNVIYITPKALTYPILLLATSYYAKQLLQNDTAPLVTIQFGSLSEKHLLIGISLASIAWKRDWLSSLGLTIAYGLSTIKVDKDNKIANAGNFLAAMILLNTMYKTFD
jgi:hypothetical protein